MSDYNDIQTLLDRIDDLERRLATQETAPRLAASGVGSGGIIVHDGGGVTVKDGGSVRISDTGSLNVEDLGNVIIRDGGDLVINEGAKMVVRYPASLGGGVMAQLGSLADGYGLMMTRPDGTRIFTARSNLSGTAHASVMYDNQGTPVAGNEFGTARGLTYPSLSAYINSSDYTTWGGNNTGGWVTVAEGYTQIYHQALWASIRCTTDVSGTTGLARITVWNSTVGEVQIGGNVAVNFSVDYNSVSGALPGGMLISDFMYVRLQTMRTGGSGSVRGTIVGTSMSP